MSGGVIYSFKIKSNKIILYDLVYIKLYNILDVPKQICHALIWTILIFYLNE